MPRVEPPDPPRPDDPDPYALALHHHAPLDCNVIASAGLEMTDFYHREHRTHRLCYQPLAAGGATGAGTATTTRGRDNQTRSAAAQQKTGTLAAMAW